MERMEDRLAILEVIAGYGDAVNRRDGEAWIACWTSDAVWSIRDKRITGASDIRAAWEGAMAGYAQVHFFSSLGALELRGDRAAARVYTQEYLRPPSGEMRTQIGEYDDELVCDGGVWRFAERSFRVRDAF
ncbi:MAG: nuclear transport factor 2 family protein [Pseudomonadota bacterium]|nr:nuclear transport factor 2 family protein [Pseudomonadota bacterium]